MKTWTLEEVNSLEESAFAAGEFVATERIIKLLERRIEMMKFCKDSECVCRQSILDFEYAIALIKGEK